MHATLGKSLHSGVLQALLLLVGIRMCAFYLPETWITPKNAIYLEMGCTLTISVAFMGFLLRLLAQEEVLDEYLTYLQDIYFQIIN